jgi:hypothetical protein
VTQLATILAAKQQRPYSDAMTEDDMNSASTIAIEIERTTPGNIAEIAIAHSGINIATS